MTARISLQHLNSCPPEAFGSVLADIWEHAPWVARSVAGQRPFPDADALHGAMVAVVAALGEDERIAFYAGHPELAGDDARRGTMTAASVDEQGALGLEHLAAHEARRWDELNRAYRERFGFPFILCIRRHTRESALRAFEQRLRNDRAAELDNALAEIAAITRLRLDRLLAPADAASAPSAPSLLTSSSIPS
ncbi:MAG: 2-oxo-4-hydroxy-4-carboxy-5-ureidoimidazoline decarboxylase [Burkholderiaceae bacterium]|nr:2-oxo-4-hydroxy-4-carboxy-5-ureidoimidazoline decarboxylase [Burkholderiaceae bacterium]